MDDPSASPTSVKARNSLLSNSLYPSSSPKPTRRLSSSSSSVYSTCSTSEMSTSRSTGGLFQQTSMALQNFAIESILAASAAPPRLPVAQNKEPLSLPTTTKNFRGFVQKSGPMFWFQDGVEATLMWQDASWTLMWMAIWAVISVYPWMLLLAPSMILSIILVMTHKARYQDSMTHNIARKQVPKSPNSKSKSTVDLYAHNNASPAEVLDYATSLPTATGEGIAQPPLTPNPPHEGTVKYYENLRDIQNMMRMIIDGYDLLAPTVPYLNWSSYTRSLHILQLSLLTTLLMFFVAPYVPYRAVMLFAGEGVFIVNHPWTKPALEGVLKRMETSGQGRKLIRIVKEGGHRVREWIELDGLDDHVWEKGWRNVEVFENERFSKMKKGASSSGVVGGWSAHNLRMDERMAWTKGPDGWSQDQLDVLPGSKIDISRQVGMKLESGWEWVEGDDWRIDWGGSWSTVGVDDEGYVYTDSSWQKPASFAYGHGGGLPDYPPSIFDFQNLDHVDNSQTDHQDQVHGENHVVASDTTSVLSALSAGMVDHHPKKMRAETRRRRWLRRAVRTCD